MALALTALMFFMGFQTPQNTTGGIVGSVIRGDNGTPLSDVQVTLRPEAGRTGQEVRVATDTNGQFRVRDVPPGMHALEVAKEGYVASRTGTGSVIRIRVEPGAESRVPPISLFPPATIVGEVHDSNRKPVAGLAVEALRIIYTELGVRQWEVVQRSVTDANGAYSMSFFGAGNHYIRVFSGYYPKQVQASENSSLLAVTYFPSVRDPLQAAALSVNPGAVLRATLSIPQPAETYRISGKVVNSLPDQAALPRITLILVPSSPNAPREPQMQRQTNVVLPQGSAGSFELTGVSPGDYELFAETRIANPVPGATVPGPVVVGRTPVIVRNSDLTDLTLVLHAGVNVTGRVTVLGTSPGVKIGQQGSGAGGSREGDPMMVMLNLTSIDNSPVGNIRSPIGNGAEFAFSNISPGRYGLSVAAMNRNAYIEDVRQDGRSIRDGFGVGDGATEPIDVIIGMRGGQVDGMIAGAEKTTATVVLVPISKDQRNWTRFKSALTSTGRFTIFGVPPGEYRAYAWHYTSPSSLPLFNPEFVEKNEQRGVIVRVQEGTQANLNLTLLRYD